MTVPIFYTIDENYVPYTVTSIASLVANAEPDRKYEIIIVHEGLSRQSQEVLFAFERANIHIRLEKMQENLDMITDRMENRLRSDYLSLPIYFRLFIPAMFPEYDKAIYIDGDTIINDDIAKLYNIDLGDKLIGATVDSSIQDVAPIITFINQAMGMDKTEYINSGMLVFNMVAMRCLKLEERFLNLLNTYHFDCIAPDQDYLNAMTYGAIRYLPTTWNRMPVNGQKLENSPSLIHYNLFDKPWHYEGVAYEDFFWQYAKQTPYYQDLLMERQYFADQAKDKKNLQLLLQRAQTISQQNVTFASIFGGGKEMRLGEIHAITESCTCH